MAAEILSDCAACDFCTTTRRRHATAIYLLFRRYVPAISGTRAGSDRRRFRKDRPPITKSVLCWTFSLALIGITVSQNLLSASLYYISSSVEAAVLNMIPVFTYILTIVSRQEKFGINTNWGRRKLIGTLLSVSLVH
ncbi:hypothetical protein MRB53_021169 [Persea americana]|uniref:Uncharacterized protein n=1 Tax=Persea americana TaxID=3435 RepID=A0ACC2L3C5_PERAE|nr:hypothetical protein MRB53_021169 [Persea americana]